MTFLEALKHSPGPASLREAFILWLKGCLMGTADIIPGVSGGTMAFITGIYGQLIEAIKSFDLAFFRRLAGLRFTEAIAGVHLRFLLPLLLGIGLALVSTARLMHFLLEHYPVPVWSLFFGLIAASIIVVGRQVPAWKADTITALVLGTVLGFAIVGIIPVTTPETLWFVFLCGVVSICAMILPGISGAFILLILGKYQYITGAIKDPLDFGNLAIIACFFCGAAIGLAGFSRVLSYLFKNFHNFTVALLTGFMLGAMRKIWPWKEVVESKLIRGKLHVLQEANVLPPAVDGELFLALALAAAGFVVVLLLDRLSESKGINQT